MENHVSLLGWRVKDKVTGYVGVVSHVGIDLYGCVQAILHAEVVRDKEGGQKAGDPAWFDVSRLEKIGRAPVMQPIPVKGDLVVAGCDVRKPVK